jgi:hypothetical protein
MPRQSNDEDLVTYTISKPTMIHTLKALPRILHPSLRTTHFAQSQNTPRLPARLKSSDPVALFDLFFDDKAIEIKSIATNENARHKKAKPVADRAADSPEEKKGGPGEMSRTMKY